MSEHTEIPWCDSTINGSSGCDGCELYKPAADGTDEDAPCYAKWLHERRLAKAFKTVGYYAPHFNEVRMIPGRFMQAARWSDLRGKNRPDKPWLNGKPRHIFVGDMGDFLSEAVTDEFLERELLAAIKSPDGQRHVWLLLTKRPARLAALSRKWGRLPANVVAMTTLTNQRTADVRIPQLLDVVCTTRGLSIEPLWAAMKLPRVDFHCSVCGGTGLLGRIPGGECASCSGRGCIPAISTDPQFGMGDTPMRSIHWVIAGGESAVTKARTPEPMHPAWIVSLRDQCAEARVPFFFKQWGAWAPSNCQPIRGIHTGGGIYLHPDGRWGCQGDWWEGRAVAMERVGKGAPRRLGIHEYNEMPSVEVAA